MPKAVDRATFIPTDGAALLIVTVPFDPEPPGTSVGFSVRPVRLGAVTVNVAEAHWALLLASSNAVVSTGTGVVWIWNVALDSPELTVTEDGTVTAWTVLDSPTTMPALGAGALNVTVPVALPPPATLVALTVNDSV